MILFDMFYSNLRYISYFNFGFNDNLKYKTVETKVKPVAGPLPANSEQKRKDVWGDPKPRKSVDIGQAFTDEIGKKLRIGGGGFLLQKEEERFREMLE